MKKSNFILIVIIIIIIGAIIQFNSKNQEQETKNNHLKDTINELRKQDERSKQDKLRKQEMQKPIKIKKQQFDVIVDYVLSQKEDTNLLPKELSEEKKEKIESIKNTLKQSIKRMSETQERRKQEIQGYQEQIDQQNASILNILNHQKPKLERDLIPLKEKQSNLEIEIKEQEDLKIVATNSNERKKIQQKIDQLEDEESKIINKIRTINIEIGKLENKLERLREQQKLVLDIQRQLQESYDFFFSISDDKESVIEQLNALFEITEE